MTDLTDIDPNAGWLAIIITAIGAGVTVSANVLKKKQTMELALIDSLQKQVDELHDKIDERDARFDAAVKAHNAEFKKLMNLRIQDLAHIQALEAHIKAKLPPPPPNRPKI